MLDFAKLNDPVYREEMRVRREAEEAVRAAEESRIDGIVSDLMDKYDTLPDRERQFVGSVRMQRLQYHVTSSKQLAWLESLHTKHCGAESEAPPVEAVEPELPAPQKKRFSFSRP